MNEAQFLELAAKVSRSSIAIIDAISQRGAFKGEELSTIGTLRDQCIQMVQLCEQMQQEAAMDSDDEEEE